MSNPQLDLAHRYVELTGTSVFLTGKAGTGKTTFLRDIAANCPKRHIVVAPTGVAAVNAGGVTIHSFFQLPFDPYLPDIKELVTEYQLPERHKGLNKNKLDIIRTLELLIIDEVSMVRADLIDAIDMTLRRHRRSSRPFGGVQLLMIGDVHQLAPVVTDDERDYMERVYHSPYFFASKALQRLDYVTIELTTVYRQQDAAFVDLLNHVRNNRLDNDTLDKLNARVQPSFNLRGVPSARPTAEARDLGELTPTADLTITLTTHNRQADAINRRHMEALNGECRIFDAEVKGNYAESSMPVAEHLEIKVGERVMLAKNDSSGAHRYYNGMLATVTGFTTIDEGEYIEVINDEGDIINVGREVWENIRYSLNAKGDIVQTAEGTFSQYPLRPAWAVTIHKAQGLTFDRVAIDAADAFAFGQVYVALSRCRSLEGLTLTTPLTSSVAFSDSGVEHFVDSQPTYEQVSQAVDDHERQYYYGQLCDLFCFDSLSVDAERLTKSYNHLQNLYPDKVGAMQHLRDSLADMASVGERFRNQLMRLPPEQHADRIAKACDYYLPLLKAAGSSLEVLLDVEIDNKDTRQHIANDGKALTSRLGEKTACLTAVKSDGFSIAGVQKARAGYLLQKPTKNEKRKTKTEGKSGSTPLDRNVDLLKTLTLWRRAKAAEEHVAPYMVLNQKALLAIAANAPATEAELKRLPGIGPKTLQKYGAELIEMVISG